MKVVRCTSGHFYDGDAYGVCPHCGAPENRENGADRTVNTASQSSDYVDEATVAINRKPANFNSETEKVVTEPEINGAFAEITGNRAVVNNDAENNAPVFEDEATVMVKHRPVYSAPFEPVDIPVPEVFQPVEIAVPVVEVPVIETPDAEAPTAENAAEELPSEIVFPAVNNGEKAFAPAPMPIKQRGFTKTSSFQFPSVNLQEDNMESEIIESPEVTEEPAAVGETDMTTEISSSEESEKSAEPITMEEFSFAQEVEITHEPEIIESPNTADTPAFAEIGEISAVTAFAEAEDVVEETDEEAVPAFEEVEIIEESKESVTVEEPEAVKEDITVEVPEITEEPVPFEEEIQDPIEDSDEKTIGFFKAAPVRYGSEGVTFNKGTDPVVGWIVCVGGAHWGESFSIGAGKNSIGRNSSNRIVLSRETSVSREKHAFIIYEPKKMNFFVQPGDSSGLTYLNDEYITDTQPISSGDIIELGDSQFMFVPLCGPDFSW